ncbi:MAG: LysR family transcriptional regulator, partial [Pseudomonadota bacterium]|nr:LysR family transcriptional regulator [Pseudomonadota bacterium]
MPTPHLPSLNLIRVFEVAARRLSFKDAANELFVS